MNTVFQKWGNKFSVSKFQQLWKKSYNERKFSINAMRHYLYISNGSRLTAFVCRSCNQKSLELNSAIYFCGRHAVRLLNVSRNRCWKCNAVVIERDLVCMSCGSIQEPRQKLNHFEIFKETPHFDIDERNLTVKFRRLQTLLHPDKFASRSEREQEYSAEQSSRVNKAYQTLYRPLDRGLYLLELHEKPLVEDEIQLLPEFLSDVMEVNEMLVACRTADDLESVRHVNDAKLQLLYSDVSVAFKEKNIARARESLCKLKYYVNIEQKIRKMEEEFGVSRDD